MTVLAAPDLLLAAHRGDRAALERVLGHCRLDLRRYAEYHCWVHDVEDAVQESMFTVARRLGDLRQLECFASWLFRIVKRECNRLARVRRRFAGQPITEDILPAVLPEPVELRRDVAAALESLPDHYRDVVLMRDLEGLTIEEMAARLALTREAVKSRLHRARVLVREYLGRE